MVDRDAPLAWIGVSVDLGAFALRDVSLSVPQGAWVAIVGPTGAGKSLLLDVAAGFLAPTAGRVLRGGLDVTELPPESRRLGYVPQDDLLFPCADVGANLRFGHRAEGAAERSVAAIASQLEIDHLLTRRTRGLSGGEAQRVALGRAVLSGTDLLLLDECTSALDSATKARVGGLVSEWRRRWGLTIVQVTHDLAEAGALADQVVRMEAGRIVA